MRLACLLLALLIGTAVAAPDQGKKKQIVHKKPTAEQIRKFKALEKKQKRRELKQAQ